MILLVHAPPFHTQPAVSLAQAAAVFALAQGGGGGGGGVARVKSQWNSRSEPKEIQLPYRWVSFASAMKVPWGAAVFVDWTWPAAKLPRNSDEITSPSMEYVPFPPAPNDRVAGTLPWQKDFPLTTLQQCSAQRSVPIHSPSINACGFGGGTARLAAAAAVACAVTSSSSIVRRSAC